MDSRFLLSRQAVRRSSGTLALVACLSLPWVWAASMEPTPRARTLEKVGGVGQLIDHGLSSDGSVFVDSEASDQPIRVWDVHSGKARLWLEGDSQRKRIAVNRDGSILAVAMESGRILRLSTTGEKEFRELVSDRTVDFLAFSGDGNLLVTATWNGLVSVWDLSTERIYKAFTVDATIKGWTAPALSADGHTLAWITMDNNSRQHLSIYDVTTGHLRAQPTFTPFLGLAFSPDSHTLALSGPGKVLLLDAANGQVVGSYDHPDYPDFVTFSPDGKTLAVAYYHCDPRGQTMPSWLASMGFRSYLYPRYYGLDVLDVGSGKRQAQLQFRWWVGGNIAFLPDSKSLAVYTDEGIGIWDLPPSTRLPGFGAWAFGALTLGCCLLWYRTGGPEALLGSLAARWEQGVVSAWGIAGAKYGALAGAAVGAIAACLVLIAQFSSNLVEERIRGRSNAFVMVSFLVVLSFGGAAVGLVIGSCVRRFHSLLRKLVGKIDSWSAVERDV